MGAPFHADISLPAGSAAGSYALFDPMGPVLITHARFSTDTGQRFVIGVADVDGQRVLAGNIGAANGAIADLHLDTGGTGLVGQILVITAAASGFDAAIDGCYLP